MKKVKVQKILDEGHSLMNEVVMDTAKILETATFVVKLDDCLKDRGLTQKDLAQMTGMRIGTVSDIANGKGISLNKAQLLAIMSALRITNLYDLFEIRLMDEQHELFEKEKQEWIESKHMPENVRELYKKNVLKLSGLD